MGNNPQQVDKFNKQTDKRFFIFPSKPVYSLLMVSLDAAGKTTLLYNMILG
jgi:GTPase SAR1 family protein